MDKYFREAEVKQDESEPNAVSILLSASEMQHHTDDTRVLSGMPLGVCNWIYMKPMLQFFLGTRSSPENLVCSRRKG